VLHILTVHYQTPRWIDLQLDFIERNIHVPYKTYGSIEAIEERDASRFDVIVPAYGPHAGKLNYLAAVASHAATSEDMLMFIDGDAFPIVDPMPVVEKSLANSVLVAVQRAENLGDRQPHPCFAVTTVGTWRRINGDWSKGHPWPIEFGGMTVSDVGGNLLYLLESHGEAWTPLLRTNTRNLHPLYFAVYGDIVYHHGAGFRRPVARVDHSQNPYLRMSGLVRKVWRRQRERQNQAQSDWVFKRIREDPLFYREICGVGLDDAARRG
jgi:hypothetical protein